MKWETEFVNAGSRRIYHKQTWQKKIGISDNTISNIETGSNNVKLENIEKVADYFEVSLDYLVKGTGQVSFDDVFVNRYLRLSPEDKQKMLSVLSTFYPESA